MIGLTNTVVGPRTMVIKPPHAAAADMAVFGPQLLPSMAVLTPPACADNYVSVCFQHVI